ncbi:MAG: cation:proton antiporter subunit C [Deinococcota bacterium]|jgi:multicomponent Na+:H+ antiporter subunit C|nr:cation:proton antiporter subunit C [Deinococcota bacterium]
MSQTLLYALAGILLFSLGLYALLGSRHLLRKILALNVMSSAVFLFLVSMAARNPGEPPDPVPHAMVLTGIVVALSATAFALALARRIYAQTGHTRLPGKESP